MLPRGQRRQGDRTMSQIEELYKDLTNKWKDEIESWEHSAEMCANEESVSSRCRVRAATIKGCLDDLKNNYLRCIKS